MQVSRALVSFCPGLTTVATSPRISKLHVKSIEVHTHLLSVSCSCKLPPPPRAVVVVVVVVVALVLAVGLLLDAWHCWWMGLLLVNVGDYGA